ncbi:hypothetical protein CGCF413_v015204 [Colletotrichum fructicola]|nr:hypothetical protein CGCF413_v015204 [Colletotrichum fructicola]
MLVRPAVLVRVPSDFIFRPSKLLEYAVDISLIHPGTQKALARTRSFLSRTEEYCFPTRFNKPRKLLGSIRDITAHILSPLRSIAPSLNIARVLDTLRNSKYEQKNGTIEALMLRLCLGARKSSQYDVFLRSLLGRNSALCGHVATVATVGYP